MLFIQEVGDTIQLIELKSGWSTDEFVINSWGYPVEILIVEESDEWDTICEPEDIGWFDEGEESDELREFTLKEANTILADYNGLLEIQIVEEFFDYDESVVPFYVEQKVIIKYVEDEEID